MMPVVGHTITLNETTIASDPEQWSDVGVGVLVLFKPEDVREDPALSGKPVSVRTPDGRRYRRTVTRSSRRRAVALFFAGMDARDIPVGSEVKW